MLLKCPNCGQELEDGDLFCTNCGVRIAEPAATAAVPRATAPDRETPGGEGYRKYWLFLLRTLKHPLAQGVRETHPYFGYISFLLTSLLFSIGLTSWINHMISSFVKMLPVVDQAAVSNFMLNYYQVFFFILLDTFAIAAVTYGVIKLVYRSNLGFNVFVTQYAAIGTPVLALSLLTLVIGLAEIGGTFPLIIISFNFSLLFLPSTVLLYAVKNNGTMDRVYAYLITLVATTFVQYFAVRIAIDPLMTAIQSLFKSIINSVGSFPF
jgi:hypothetical protein